jgi:hypothetical protein
VARSQNGTTSKLRVNVGGCNFVAGITVACIANITGRNLNWRSLLCPLNSGGTPQGWSFEVDSSNHLVFTSLAVTGASTSTIATTDGWRLYAATKVAGTTSPRLHSYRYSDGAIFHEAAAASFADGTAPGSTGFIDIGGDAGGSGDWFIGDYEMGGIWNAALSDSQVEALAFDLLAWFQVAPAGLWRLDQSATGQKVVDLAGGGANESTSTALGISTASVPVFNYGDGIWTPTIVKPAGGGTTFTQTLSATAGSTATVTRQVNAVRSAASAPSAVIVRQVNVIRAATSSATASVVKQANLIRAATAGSTATIASTKVFLLTLSASSAAVATISNVRSRFLTLACSAAATAVMARAVRKTLTASTAGSAQVTALGPGSGSSGTPPQRPTLGVG